MCAEKKLCFNNIGPILHQHQIYFFHLYNHEYAIILQKSKQNDKLPFRA